MVVSRFVGGKEISIAELGSITITNNHQVGAAINRVVARINSDTRSAEISTTHIPAQKYVAKPAEIEGGQ